MRPQWANLQVQVQAWNMRYQAVEAALAHTPGLTLISRPKEESYVGSSIQFLLLDWAADRIENLLATSSSSLDCVMDRLRASLGA